MVGQFLTDNARELVLDLGEQTSLLGGGGGTHHTHTHTHDEMTNCAGKGQNLIPNLAVRAVSLDERLLLFTQLVPWLLALRRRAGWAITLCSWTRKHGSPSPNAGGLPYLASSSFSLACPAHSPPLRTPETLPEMLPGPPSSHLGTGARKTIGYPVSHDQAEPTRPA